MHRDSSNIKTFALCITYGDTLLIRKIWYKIRMKYTLLFLVFFTALASQARGVNLFNKFDTDGDGIVSTDEIESAKSNAQEKAGKVKNEIRKKAKQLKADANAAFMEAADTNDDGIVSEEEFDALKQQIKTTFQKINAAVLVTCNELEDEAIDQNANNIIDTKDEAKACASALYLQFDTDGDGFVSQEEFQAAGMESFESADTNGDGQISEAELQKALTKRLKKAKSKL